MTRPWMRLAVSAFLVFHLLGVLSAPNPSSYLNLSLTKIYRPYMNFFGLANSWGFFAPEPVSSPMYIDYTLAKKNGDTVSGRFPAEKDPFFFRDRQNRRMSLARFIAGSDDNIRNMFVHYECNHEAGVESMQLWRTTLTSPSLEDVQKGVKKMTDPADYKIEVLGTYFCPEKS